MIVKLAWKNIWRAHLRSLIVIGSVVVGVWALIFMMGFTKAMSNSYVDKAIRFRTSHIQLHNPKFIEDKNVKYTLNVALYNRIKKMPEVKESNIHSLANGMIRSSRATRGVNIKGVEPEQELKISHIDQVITDGHYFSKDKKHEILISEELAQRLKVKLRKKIVLYFQDLKGNVTTGSFRIIGIFKTGNKPYDVGNVYVKRTELNNYLGDVNVAHEVSILLKEKKTLHSTQLKLADMFPKLSVQNYTEISPDIKLFESQIYMIANVMLFIFMLALIFGIVNTMLMAILERIHELGMLIAIGMVRVKIFWMIVLETFFLSIVGAPIGMLLGWLTISWLKIKGIDLSSVAKGAEQFGMDTIVYPQLDFNIIVQLTIAVLITAIVAAIYPALKAVRLQPLDAIRKQ